MQSRERFEFGVNWSQFLNVLNDDRIYMACASLKRMLGVDNLCGKSFLDIGSGSGLFSLAARRLGATVYSFDYDPKSVACTAELKRRYYPEDKNWVIEEGSVLDLDFLLPLGQFDVVYSWGVLHHTGAMWQALSNVPCLVRGGGNMFIAIYNDQGWQSKYWASVKRFYNIGMLGKWLMILLHLPYLLCARYVVRMLTGRLRGERGMSLWYDMLDWLGGYPFEVATPEQIVIFFRDKDFVLDNLKTCRGRLGCNEFVFTKNNAGNSV